MFLHILVFDSPVHILNKEAMAQLLLADAMVTKTNLKIEQCMKITLTTYTVIK